MRRCFKCNTENNDSDPFCKSCGWQTYEDYMRHGPRKPPPVPSLRHSGIEWHDKLLRTLLDNGVTQPFQDVGVGRALVWFGLALTIGVALLMLGLAYWNSASADIDMSDYNEMMRRPGITSQEIAWLVAEKERVSLQREMERDKYNAIFGSACAVLYPTGLFLATYLLVKGRRTLTPNAFAELDRLPDRRLILFLRSFERDASEKATVKGLPSRRPVRTRRRKRASAPRARHRCGKAR